jgi:hypothetical protein
MMLHSGLLIKWASSAGSTNTTATFYTQLLLMLPIIPSAVEASASTTDATVTSTSAAAAINRVRVLVAFDANSTLIT